MGSTPEPTANSEPASAAINESVLIDATEPNIAPEPELNEMSDQVHEPATKSVVVGILVEIKGADS